MKTAEQVRLEEARQNEKLWKMWGPYLTERQWGTVREDYSDNGDAWNFFTHDQARRYRDTRVQHAFMQSRAPADRAIGHDDAFGDGRETMGPHARKEQASVQRRSRHDAPAGDQR